MHASVSHLFASLFIAAVSLIPIAQADEAEPATPVGAFQIGGTEVHTIESPTGDEVYRLLVSLPEGYDPAGDTRYPVFYILDGHQYFATAVNSYRVQRLGNDVTPLIIVGIAYPTEEDAPWLARRATEWTPTGSEEFDASYTEQQGFDTASGGAERFRTVLSTEILPFIDTQFQTTGVEGVFGHSLGGLYATYDLLQAPPTFDRYSISSPSLWWDDGVIFQQEMTYAETHTDLSADVFLSVGALEGPQMVPPMQRLEDTLSARNYASLTLTTKVFEDETHLSVQPGTLSRALRVLFAPETEDLAEKAD